jgi:Ribosomal L28e protein family
VASYQTWKGLPSNTAVMSTDLVWELVRPWNCNQIYRSHPVRRFTTEKGSLCGSVKSADSGLAGRRAVHVDADENGVPELSRKNGREGDLRKPDKMWKTISLRGGARKAIAKADSALTMYRPAARKHALRKVSLLARAQARANSGVNHKKVKTGRTVRS